MGIVDGLPIILNNAKWGVLENETAIEWWIEPWGLWECGNQNSTVGVRDLLVIHGDTEGLFYLFARKVFLLSGALV